VTMGRQEEAAMERRERVTMGRRERVAMGVRRGWPWASGEGGHGASEGSPVCHQGGDKNPSPIFSGPWWGVDSQDVEVQSGIES
jgi:hypothetical protein